MKQIIEDNSFNDGFMLCHTDALVSREPIKRFTFGEMSEAKPIWKIAQWCSRYNLANGREKIYDDASYEYSDETKSVRVWRGKGRIKLSLEASKEYFHPRREGENWPHILIEQEFQEDYFLSRLKETEQQIEFTITRFCDHMSSDEKNMLHTAQFQWFLAIQNRNKSSKGYGDFFWFGLPFWDYPRYNYPPEFKAVDGGKEENTGKFINIIGAGEFLKNPVTIGETVSLSVPVYDRIKEGFECAKANHYLKDSDWQDMCIGNMNLGFEVTGTFDVEVTINKLNIFIKEGK